MSTTKGIERRYEDEVKKAATRLANDILADPRGFWDLDKHAHEFRCWVKSAQVRREERLAKLQTVKVDLGHLITLKEWFVKAVKTAGPAKFHNEFGRYPVCFGGGCKHSIGPPKEYVDSDLCQACQAISPLIEDDC